MAVLGRTELDVFPICLGGNVFGWTADEEQSPRGAERVRRLRRQLRRQRQLLPGRARALGDDHRPVDGRPRQPRPDRPRDEGRRRQGRGAQPAARQHRARGPRLAAAPADRSHRPLLRALRRRGDPAGRHPARLRRTRAVRARAPHRGVQLHAAAADGGARAAARARAGRVSPHCSRTTTSSSASSSARCCRSPRSGTSRCCPTSRWPRAS
jgi:hypothetical protein